LLLNDNRFYLLKIDDLIVETPIGSLLFKFQASEGDLSSASVRASILEPYIPDGMTVEGCIAVLLRVNPTTPIRDLNFTCSWMNLSIDGSGCTGEALDAWEWEKNGKLVIVGTEDGDCLGSRLNIEEQIQDNYPVTFLNNCIAINIQEFPESKDLTLHYIISWNSLPENIDSACWYAVDVAHKKVITACT